MTCRITTHNPEYSPTDDRTPTFGDLVKIVNPLSDYRGSIGQITGIYLSGSSLNYDLSVPKKGLVAEISRKVFKTNPRINISETSSGITLV